MLNSITQLFGIKYPIVQGGMIWSSGWKLASAVSNAGGLGLIGSGSMYPHVLKEHIQKCKKATTKPFGVNIPLLYPNIEEHIETVIQEKVPIVFTSAGNPKLWTSKLKEHGIKVVHVIANIKFALKCVDAGVDAIVAEGFEAGGHNGIEETTTMVLIPEIVKQVTIPVIAAGGIGSGQAMYAAIALGASGVQIGSLFVATQESSAHINFKNKIIEAKEGNTKLALKQLTPVRLLNNAFAQQVQHAQNKGATIEELQTLLGKGRAKLGMFEGNVDDGELEIGQVASSINKISTAQEVINLLVEEFNITKQKLITLSL